MNAHSHGLNNHTHSFSWGGTTSEMSEHSTGYFGRWSAYDLNGDRLAVDGSTFTWEEKIRSSGVDKGGTDTYGQFNMDISHTHTYSGSGTTGGNSGNTTSVTPTGSFTGTLSSTGGASGNTAATAPSAFFSGTQSTTLNTGSNTAFSILPPYAVRYCWQRIA